MRNKNYIFGITLVATLGGLLFGYDTAVISGTVESLRKFFIEPYNLPLDQANALEGFVVSSALIGCILGASFAGLLSQRYGRKPTLILAAVLFLLSAIGSSWPELFFGMPGSGDHSFMYNFVAYRILGGVGVGLASMVSPMYIAEVAPADRRGNLVSWNQFAIIFGMLVVYFVNYWIALQGDAQWLHSIGWRWMFASEVIPAILFLIFLFLVPETPRYLVMRGKTSAASAILHKLLDRQEAEKELADIQESFKEKAPSLRPYFKFMGAWLLTFVILFAALELLGNTNALELALIFSFVISLIFPIRSFGVVIIMVGILLSAFQQFVGINVVLYYAPEIFKTMGANTDVALLQQIIVGAINLSFTVLAIFTVDRFGRRPLMIIGALVMSVAMLLLGTTFYTNSVGMGSLICMLVYTAGFAMSWGPVCWVLLAEIFPNSIRSTVMSIAVAGQWVANFLVSWTFPMLDKNQYLTDNFNHGVSYWIYGVMGLLAAFFIWKMVPETKGKTLEEMEKYWKR
ncbi:D-xylose transporter XylE [Macellibacteroides fermentans]|uniref:SP family xylose:H+ symportor-like MFS transporter n=1 Tax=Macellibacteroides fermentans TaxID=879969 RepID=A0A8E2D3Y2_9PORP|nr:D-xylose transporter XylE [Macellibacteroides fermentans]NYI48263.1 SP family xylose:H+ symportor-like MFS transporter [Macellibacteroides fermentans]